MLGQKKKLWHKALIFVAICVLLGILSPHHRGAKNQAPLRRMNAYMQAALASQHMDAPREDYMDTILTPEEGEKYFKLKK